MTPELKRFLYMYNSPDYSKKEIMHALKSLSRKVPDEKEFGLLIKDLLQNIDEDF